MALSNSFDFTLTRDTLITEAMERLGVIRLNKTPSADQLASASRSLNLKVKQLQGDGLQLFSYRDAFLFLEKNETTYLLGPSGDKATESYVKTQLAVAALAAATTITVDSATGISNANNIGIELDDGTLQWTTVSGAPAGAVITLAAGLNAAAAIDRYVFAYATTSQIQRALSVSDLFVRDVNDDDSTVELYSMSEYRDMTDKLSLGQIVSAVFDPQLTNARLMVWPVNDSVTDVLGFVYKKPVDDFDVAGDNPAFPVDWFEYLVCELTVILSSKFGLPLQERQWHSVQAKEAKMALWDNEESSLFVVPDLRR